MMSKPREGGLLSHHFNRLHQHVKAKLITSGLMRYEVLP